MSDRLARMFGRCAEENRAALGIFITASDPDVDTSQAILDHLPGAGADMIEFGMPFSDPMADGPAIQASSQRALRAGARWRAPWAWSAGSATVTGRPRWC